MVFFETKPVFKKQKFFCKNLTQVIDDAKMSDTDSVISSNASVCARSFCSSNSLDSSTVDDIICTDLQTVRKTSQLKHMPEFCEASVRNCHSSAFEFWRN